VALLFSGELSLLIPNSIAELIPNSIAEEIRLIEEGKFGISFWMKDLGPKFFLTIN